MGPNDENVRTQLLALLSALAGTSTARDRRALIDSLGFSHLHNRIEWEGSTLAFFTGLLDVLAADGRESLVHFLMRIEQGDWMGLEQKQQLSALRNAVTALTTQQWELQFPQQSTEQWIPPPPRPTRPPSTAGFVGREAELAYYADKLAETHLAIIVGMAGVGKTMLAAKLAQRHDDGERVFWHSFHEDEDVQVVIWKLAGFLYWHGHPELWHRLQGAESTGAQPSPPEILFDSLLQVLRGQNYLICLDDFQFVQDDPLQEQFIEQARQVVESGELEIILTSRRLPDDVPATEYPPLHGMSLADTHQLLEERGLVLSADLTAILYEQTEGNAELLALAIQALQHTQNHVRLLAHLVETRDVRRFLMDQVNAQLTSDEQQIMAAVALFLGYAATADAVEAVLDDDVAFGVWELLTDLGDRFLLQVGEEDAEPVYSHHSLVQDFFYKQLNRRERLTMHQRAGAYFEHEYVDALQAARHYRRAREFSKSARLATENVWVLINRYQAQPLARLLDRYSSDHLSAEEWVRVRLACGTVQAFIGDRSRAQSCYTMSIEQLDAMPDAPGTCELRIQAYCNMGQLLCEERPHEAIDWLQRGLDQLPNCEVSDAAVTEATFHIALGWAQQRLGHHAEALDALLYGLEHLPPGLSRLRTRALNSLTATCMAQGNLQDALMYADAALQDSRRLHDVQQEQQALSNLAGLKYFQNDWRGAAEDSAQVLQIAIRLNDNQTIAALNVNLGVTYLKIGDTESALAHLSRGLQLAQEMEFQHYELIAHSTLAKLWMRLHEWQTAEEHLCQAENVAQSSHRQYLALVHRRWAQLNLETGDPQAALDHAQEAVLCAEQPTERTKSQRVLGQALCANEQPEQAEAVFQECLALLADTEPYETARTQVQYGQALVAWGSVDDGTKLIEQARAVFRKLGAEFDLAELEH